MIEHTLVFLYALIYTTLLIRIRDGALPDD